MTLAAWLHDLGPFLWEIRPGVGLRWYGLSYVAGFVLGYFALRFLARRGATPIPAERAMDVIMYAALGAVAGGRLGYVLFYQPSLLWDFSSSFPWWGVFELQRGGMASHGGIVGVVLVGFLLARGFKTQSGTRLGSAPVLHVLDVFALLAPFGLLLGRLANFVNGELLGRIVARAGQHAPWWSIRFPQEALERPAELSPDQRDGLLRTVGLDPASLGPAGWDAEFKPRYEALLRKLQAGSDEAARLLEPWINARHPSQLYQAAAEGLMVGLIIWLIARRPRKPGIVGAWFLISYGILRVVTELWRLPDAHLATARIAGLSRGQWLSVLMGLAGVAMIVLIQTRRSPRMGGWATRATHPEAASSDASAS